MTVELALLFWSIAVYALYLGSQTLFYRVQYGLMHAATARDHDAPPGVHLARAQRALNNFLETWPIFVILALVANFADAGDPVVFWGAVVWYVSRIVYLPLYLAGVFGWRSLAWNVSAVGLALMFFGVLF